DVVLTSEEGVGSRFRGLAPRTQISAPARHARTRARSAPRASRPRAERAIGAEFAGRLVAVVDDDATTVDAMRTLFETWGAVVIGGAKPDALLGRLGVLGRYSEHT